MLLLDLLAKPIFLRPKFRREFLAEVRGLEDLPNLDLRLLAGRVRASIASAILE